MQRAASARFLFPWLIRFNKIKADIQIDSSLDLDERGD